MIGQEIFVYQSRVFEKRYSQQKIVTHSQINDKLGEQNDKNLNSMEEIKIKSLDIKITEETECLLCRFGYQKMIKFFDIIFYTAKKFMRSNKFTQVKSIKISA